MKLKSVGKSQQDKHIRKSKKALSLNDPKDLLTVRGNKNAIKIYIINLAGVAICRFC